MEVALRLHALGVELWQASCLLKVEMVDILLRLKNREVQGQLQTYKRMKKRKMGALLQLHPVEVELQHASCRKLNCGQIC